MGQNAPNPEEVAEWRTISGFRFTWFGHACVEVETPGGKRVLFDPWFGNPLSPRSADQVQACDVMLVSHGHGDHLGDSIALASRLRPVWPSIHEMSLWLARRVCPGFRTRRSA